MKKTFILFAAFFCWYTLSAQVKIAVLGSSTALGAGATSGYTSWMGRLQAHYRQNTNPGDPDTVVYAKGGYGYTTYRVLPTGYTPPIYREGQPIDPANNITAILADNPQILIINLPSNDVGFAYSATPPYTVKESMDNFRVLYNHAVSRGVTCYITSSQPRNDYPDHMRKLLRDLRDSIVATFTTNSIDYYDDLVTPDGTNRLRDDVRHLGFPDADYHLNDYGHQLIYQKVVARNIFGPQAPPPPPPPPPSSSGRIEAEHYTAMSGIQTEPTSDVGGGLNVGWQDTNDWMDYSVNVSTAGTYTVNFRVATMFNGPQFQLRNSSGTVLATVNVPNTGSFQAWQTVSAQVNLPAGQQTLRIHTSNAAGGWNINWWEIAGISSTPPPPPPPPSSSSKIEAEHYTAMFGIQTEPTSDVGGGLNIGWQDTNDWMDYSVNVSAAGTYTVNFRVATMFNGPQFQLRNAAGTVLATVNVPNTGSFQSWQTVSAQVSLPAGQQILRIHTSNAAGGWNLNWWEIIGGTSTPPPSSSQKIEAEHYATMQGIQTEPTSDAGGGLNVGWQDSGDWMDYSVNVSSAGTYTMNFRVATMFNGPQFQVRNSAGTVMATVNVPNTGSFQTWQTISTQVSLPAGQQTIRIFTSNAAGGWNINWFEIVGGTSTSSLRTTITSNLADANEAAADRPSAVYPNPVQDRFIFTVNNELTGNFRVEIINMAGSVSKAFQLQKTLQGAVPFYLSMNGLQKGAYIIRATMGTWSFSTKVVKE